MTRKKLAHAYIVGIALGDGNLSNPNGRAIRLRVSCDNKYPKIQEEIIRNLQILFPNNKIQKTQQKTTYCDVGIYSNTLATLLPWKVGLGTKIDQNAHVPRWIFLNPRLIKECLRGLLQTDGSLYRDRGYLMINFTNHCERLSQDVYVMFIKLGYLPTFHSTQSIGRNRKYTVRLARSVLKCTKALNFYK